jgi:2-oxo-3-hexenedioate decarboxylase
MPLTDETLAELAARIDDAAHSARTLSKLTREVELSLDDAYRVQRASMARREARGDALCGMKMGLTSKAKMVQMGVHEPIYGHLTSAMRLDDGGTLERSAHCHPRCEPEVAFLLGRDLRGPVTPAEALLAVEGVCAALEIIDSRYEAFQFTLPDVVADNASSARFVLGSKLRRPSEVALENLGMVMEIEGPPKSDRRVVELGSSAAIYEHPARSLAALANLLAPLGETLRAGQVVLAGAATAAVALQPGDRVRLRVDGLGACGFFVA